MQLIDLLEERADSVGIIQSSETITCGVTNDGWGLFIDNAFYPINKSAMDQLLNILRIPIKYIDRCREDDGGEFLAQSSIDYWLSKSESLSFLTVKNDSDVVITQVFPGKGLYLPAVKVNDLVIDYLGSDTVVHSYAFSGDLYSAVYLTSQTVGIDGETFTLGVRVLYSDCFSVTPRFDGILLSESGALLGWPTLGRKFRVASNTIPQVIDQIEDFLTLSLDGLKNYLIPSLQLWQDDDINMRLVDSEKWVSRLCNDLRLSQKVRGELMHNCVITPNHLPLELCMNVCKYTNTSAREHIDAATAREIQIAASRYITTNNFKGQ